MPSLKIDEITTTVQIDSELHTHLLKVSQATGISLKRLINTAIQRYFNVVTSDPHRYKHTPDMTGLKPQTNG